MSLTSKKAMSDFKKNEFSKFKKDVEKVLGRQIVMDIDLETFNLKTMNNIEFFDTHYFKEGFDKNCFRPLLATLTKMMAEDFTHQFLTNELREIHISNRSSSDIMYGGAVFARNKLEFRPTVDNNLGTYTSQIQDVIFEAFNSAA